MRPLILGSPSGPLPPRSPWGKAGLDSCVPFQLVRRNVTPPGWVVRGPAGNADKEPKAKRIKAKGAKDLFKTEFIAERRIEGKSCNPANAEFWADFRKAWEDMSPEKMTNLKERSESSKVEAKNQRMQIKA